MRTATVESTVDNWYMLVPLLTGTASDGGYVCKMKTARIIAGRILIVLYETTQRTYRKAGSLRTDVTLYKNREGVMSCI